jgi:DNA transformation protein
MPVSANYLSYVLDQLSALGAVRSRRMFGGIGLYSGELFFGLVDDDVVYFKVDDSNRDDYTSRGCEPFRPVADDPDSISMSYFTVPEEVLEDADSVLVWARKSVMIASAAAAAKAAKKKTAKRKSNAKKAAGSSTSSSRQSSASSSRRKSGSPPRRK